MTDTVQSIFDHCPLGAWISYADGTPRPPDRFTRKLQSWEARNGSGRLTHRSPAKEDRYPATFTLRERDYENDAVIVVRVNKIFAVTDGRTFKVLDIPKPGSALVLQNLCDQPELLHVAADRAAAEGWRDRHGYGRAYVEIVGETEATNRAA